MTEPKDYTGREDLVRALLVELGEDPNREGLQETPARFWRYLKECTQGYGVDPLVHVKTFEDGAERVDELVLVKDVPIYSMCEHHMAPFHGVAHVGYIPNGRVLGLSKVARITNVFMRRLQVQERLTQQIAHFLQEHLAPVGVGVVVECRHLCMESRGVRTAGATTVTSCLLGALKHDPAARGEFMRLIR